MGVRGGGRLGNNIDGVVGVNFSVVVIGTVYLLVTVIVIVIDFVIVIIFLLINHDYSSIISLVLF